MSKNILVSLAIIFCFSFSAFSQNEPVLWLPLDSSHIERVEVTMVRGETYLPKEKIVSVHDKIKGKKSEVFGKYHEIVSGVTNNALLLDGYSSYVEIMGDNVPVFLNDFTIEAWVALGAYPTHVCPIVDNKIDSDIGYHNGYSFNIDALGRLSFLVATDGKTEELVANETIPLNQWTHVAAVYSTEDGLKIYIDGSVVQTKQVSAPFTPAVGIALDESVSNTSLLIGKSRKKSKPYGTLRPYGTQDLYSFYDGLIDEIKIYDSALSDKIISKINKLDLNKKNVSLPDRTLPSGPSGKQKFGAVNTTLDYYPAWDAPWHVGDNADVLVRFDKSDCKFLFWRGTNYIPNFISENGIWFNNAFNEGWNENGSCEPMSDKRNTYSNVKIIENNDARVVVMWRYGLVDNFNNFAFQDPETGWGDWVEEIYYVYPDMTAIRKDILYSNAPRAAHEWQEDIMVLSPGQSPEDILEYKALTMGNMAGQTATFSWEHEVPPFLPGEPENANIKRINTKSKFKPFSVIRPTDNPTYDIYAGEIRRDVSVFPWWNHWPVATKATDGRYAQFSDRPAHSSLSHWHWDSFEMTDNSITKLMLIGMTDKDYSELLNVAKSWTSYPTIYLNGDSEINYDQSEKAYKHKLLDSKDELRLTINASQESPLYNPAFVISNWGRSEISATFNGKNLKKHDQLRYGFEETLEGTDLIIWVDQISYQQAELIISKIQ